MYDSTEQTALNFCERLINPDDLGHAVSSEVRGEASGILYVAGRLPAPATKPAIERAYIAGPMSGLPGFNFEAFDTLADLLRSRRVAVQNPAEYGRQHPGQSWQHYMRQALKMLVTCDSIYLLPGWGRSEGANIEHDLAHKLGMMINYPEDWATGFPYPWGTEQRVAVCIGCGCDDFNACNDPVHGPCHWLRLDREKGRGVCSSCRQKLDEWEQ